MALSCLRAIARCFPQENGVLYNFVTFRVSSASVAGLEWSIAATLELCDH